MATALKKLKDLATDAVVVPTTAELYRRKATELDTARQKHAGIVARQIKMESLQQRRPSDTAAILAERAKSLALIDRLERDTEILAQQRHAEKPIALTPQQQVWADAFAVQPQAGRWQSATKQEIAAAQAEADALAKQCREARQSGTLGAEAKLIPSLTAAKVRLVALQGPPSPPFSRWLSKDALKAALKKRGVV
jgi:hypothetical protein